MSKYEEVTEWGRPLTKRQCAIISSYTGILIGKMDWVHEFCEELLERPVMTHEFVSKDFWKNIVELTRPYFIKLSDYSIGYNSPLGGSEYEKELIKRTGKAFKLIDQKHSPFPERVEDPNCDIVKLLEQEGEEQE